MEIVRFGKKSLLCYIITLGSSYNEFGYNEHPAIMSRSFCVKIVDCNNKKFGYNERPLITSSFFCIFLLVVSGTQCTQLL